MSLISAVKDRREDLRKKSLVQEQAIDKTGQFTQWQRSDATQVLFIERVFGVAFLPLFLFWTLILFLLSLGLGLSLALFNFLSRFFR